jgi:hypothetical protein
MALPSWFVDWILALDEQGVSVVRTPYAQHNWSNKGHLSFQTKAIRTFATKKGVGQGDVHSAHTWKLVLDILLRALESVFPLTDFHSMSTEELLAYADDLLTLCTSIAQLQQFADIISSFCNLTGLQLSLGKLRAFIKTAITDVPRSIRISSSNWEISDLVLTVNGSLRYLGCTHDLNSNRLPSSQFSATTTFLI